MPLFQYDQETVQLETWAPDATITIDTPDGAKLLVQDGDFTEGSDHLRTQS